MGRTLDTCDALPATGSSVLLRFPDIARPLPGSWDVSVTLKRDTPGTEQATIAVLQGGRIIASKQATITNSLQTVTLSVSDEELDKATVGICHVSSVQVLITGASQASCCEGVSIPNVLSVSAALTPGEAECDGCAASGGEFVLTRDEQNGWWYGSIPVCGSQWGIRIWCGDIGNELNKWWIMPMCDGVTANSPTMAVSVSCDPFELQFMSVTFGNDACNCFKDGIIQFPQWSVTITA